MHESVCHFDTLSLCGESRFDGSQSTLPKFDDRGYVEDLSHFQSSDSQTACEISSCVQLSKTFFVSVSDVNNFDGICDQWNAMRF